MKSDGDLFHEIHELGDYSIETKADATAVCRTLAQVAQQPDTDPEKSSRLRALIGLFQDVAGGDVPAFDVFAQQGLALLFKIVDDWLTKENILEKDSFLFILKIFAMYGTGQGLQRIITAAKRPVAPDDYMWHVILANFSADHPHRGQLYKELTNPLPAGFIAVALLDSANQSALADQLDEHPFDDAAGWERLRAWLSDTNPENYSYAHSATAALPFINPATRDQLLRLAMEHPDPGVQLEAAWAAAKVGREAGFKVLIRYCEDYNHSQVAIRYLHELGREELIPAVCLDPDFQALANFSNWLAHPNELGHPPDSLEIVDHRWLEWPPERLLKPFWLIRYTVRDQTGLAEDDSNIGLVGSMTWCFFTKSMRERPPEDIYAIHCCWELEHQNLIDVSDVTDAREYESLLQQWRHGKLEQPAIRHIAEISPQLGYPARLVALASGTYAEQPGFAVLDGPRSRWYPTAEQPADFTESYILSLHIGRELLGLGHEAERAKYLKRNTPPRSPEQIVTAYEKLLDAATVADPTLRAKAHESGPLAQHLADYVQALTTLRNQSPAEVWKDVYYQFLQTAKDAPSECQFTYYRLDGVIQRYFSDYTAALASLNKPHDILLAIDQLTPFWQNNMGLTQLGNAAYLAGNHELAESFFTKFLDNSPNYFRWEEMDVLAEIWANNGKIKQAQDLLIKCMQDLIKEYQESKYNCDRETSAESYQKHRQTFCKLFSAAEGELTKLGLLPQIASDLNH
ncbi:MAG: HEAT repeat domain-containing protein [Pirellulales bacterium]|nr:HEAT repeat domain-containing protein [Pirellulales bacterium]